MALQEGTAQSTRPVLDLMVEQNRAVLVDGVSNAPEQYNVRLYTDNREALQDFDLSRGVTMRPSRLIGARDSKHGVFALEITPEDTEVVQTLVVKPQSDRPERADIEFSMLRTVKAMGFTAITPLAVATQPSNSTRYLVTEYVPNLHVYTELAWRDGYLGSELHTDTLVPALREAAGFLFDIHSRGITHGDAQLKNIVRHKSGEFVLVDLENGQVHKEKDEKWLAAVADDFKSLVSSLWHLGYLQLSSPDVFSKELSEHLYDIYIRRMEEEGTADEVIEQITEAFDAAIRHAQQIKRTVRVAA